MSNNMLLMHKDTPVMEINIDEGLYEVINPKMLPYQLKGKPHHVLSYEEIHSKYDDTQRQIAIQKNFWAIIRYAGSRVLPITRDNAKKIYGLFGYEQLQDDVSKAKIAFACKAVSLQDDYWFKTENDRSQWKDVNVRHNSLSEIVAQVSLAGSSLTLQGEVCTPELNGQGAYAKAWKREPDGLYLHKTGSKIDGVNRDYESRIEVTVSNILDKCNVDHLRYEMSELYGVSTCRCRCLTDDNTSILPGMDYQSYCNVNGIDFDKKIMEIDAENIYKMWIVDYLISNRDRHGMNWGLYYNTDSMEIEKCHPLFDHNNAFDKGLMHDKQAPYLYDNRMTMQQAALKAMNNVDFHFTDGITRDDFMDNDQYNSFMERAKELEIQIKHEQAKIFSDEVIRQIKKNLGSRYSIVGFSPEGFMQIEPVKQYKNCRYQMEFDITNGKPVGRLKIDNTLITKDNIKTYKADHDRIFRDANEIVSAVAGREFAEHERDNVMR